MRFSSGNLCGHYARFYSRARGAEKSALAGRHDDAQCLGEAVQETALRALGHALHV
ncbi:MAG: hypothetical protein AB1544_13330 [Pseudomonadota bacterium]|jgi:hypothetical protein